MDDSIGNATLTNSNNMNGTASARPKVSKSGSGSNARSRQRSPNGDNEGRPQKRARKAINCEPCRNSKLKCDRNRPCSSCVLRGTTAMCYQDGGGNDPAERINKGNETTNGSIDAAQEFARIRQSLNLLESQVLGSHPPISSTATRRELWVQPKDEASSDGGEAPETVPGMLASEAQGGLYTGPTAAATHLAFHDSRLSEDASQENNGENQSSNLNFDPDLLAKLPSIDIIDTFVKEYFSYCNWIYRHINEKTFMKNWNKFKSGSSADRITLATVCVIMAVTLHYLPAQHSLLSMGNSTYEELSKQYYNIAKTALQRYVSDSRHYTLELVELLLARTQYLYLVKTETEELWHLTGELVTTGTAMGLHRDPGPWKMARDQAERRRWAWWHILLLERWQCFMFGRPLIIANHHFDTELPLYCDPAVDPTGRIYLPNLALFRLAYILGEVVDNALSVRPVPYDSVKTTDRALVKWLENIPSELALDEYGVARNLASEDDAIRRVGVQSVIIRTAYYHIRFTLHRPYASAANTSTRTSKLKRHSADPVKCAQSLEIAVSAADRLITIVSQSRPDFLANQCLAVPGHMNWGPFHCFSAAMFFAFQLIANPEQPGAGMFRSSIDKALLTLNECRGRGVSIAEKAVEILNSLSPLYSGEFQKERPEARELTKNQVISTVRKLNLPYYDSHAQRRTSESPASRAMAGSPITSPPLTTPNGTTAQSFEFFPSHHMLSNIRANENNSHLSPIFTQSQHGLQGVASSALIPTGGSPQSSTSNSTGNNYPSPSPYRQPHINSTAVAFPNFMDETMWGASTGFEQGEWSQLLSVLAPHRMDLTPGGRI